MGSTGRRRSGIGIRLGVGLAVVVVLTVLVVSINYFNSRWAAEQIRNTADFRVATVLISNEAQTALLEMLMHLHASVAREQMQQREQFERSQARFEAQLRSLASLSQLRESNDGWLRLRALQSRYDAWRALPPRIFALTADSLLNRPALNLLTEQGEVPINVVQRASADLISTQARFPSSPESNRLLSRMAAFQGSFDAQVGALRGYLNRPDERLRFEYQAQRSSNEAAWQDLQESQHLLSAEQQNLLNTISLARQSFMDLPPRIFALIDAGRYREDIYLLSTEVEPLANELLGILEVMVSSQRLSLAQELEGGLERLSQARYQSLLAGALVVLLVVALAYLVRQRFVQPLGRLDAAARRLAAGDLRARAQVESVDEVGRLAEAFNTMAERLDRTISDLEDHRWELTGLNVQLEARVAERTTALEEARDEAEGARRSAEVANQAKTSFLANMSHELRTPLNGILGYAQILQRDASLGNNQRQGVEIIRRSGDYLLTLINDVLDLAKIESARTELEPTVVELEGFLQGLADLFRMRTEQKGIAFSYRNLTFLPPAVEADEKRLRQILINLLSNAVKFTEQGRVTLDVAYEPPHLRFVVTDSGVGIAETDLDRIFEPFSQVGERCYRSAGTGLGLAITRELVTLMGGDIQVRSTLGQGSEFAVSLPLPVSRSDAQPRHAMQITGYRGKPRRLLVVMEANSEPGLLKALLSPLGFTVLEAQGANAGLSLARYEAPDLLLLDLSTADQAGLQLARRWRGDPLLGEIPVVVVSASVFQHHRQAALASGCAGFVAKPVRLEVLLEVVGQVLNLEWETTEAAAVEPDQEPLGIDTGPDPSQARQLLELAQQGDIAAIEALLETLGEEPELRGFVGKLRALSAEFQVEEIVELVKPYADSP